MVSETNRRHPMLLSAPLNRQSFAPNFRRAPRINDARAITMADAIVGLCRAGKTEITDRELTEAGFTEAEIRQLGARARSLASHKLARREQTA